ncbi:hypothetical protein A1D23_12840 [Chelonobacter oris]|nr:hypothetical protein [Chelonobacter oris]
MLFDFPLLATAWALTFADLAPHCLFASLNDVIYHFVKFERPGGEGFDGRDGDERQALAKVADAAEDYYYDILKRNNSN